MDTSSAAGSSPPSTAGWTSFTNAYQKMLRFILRFEYGGGSLFFCGLGLTYCGLPTCAQRFHSRRKTGGYFIIAVQAPQARRSNTPRHLPGRWKPFWPEVPEMDSAFSVAGFSFGGSASNRGSDFCGSESVSTSARVKSTPATPCSNACAARSSAISGAQVVPFAPPAVQGLGQFGGFQFVLEDQTGGSDPRAGRCHHENGSGRKQQP